MATKMDEQHKHTMHDSRCGSVSVSLIEVMDNKQCYHDGCWFESEYSINTSR
jgi:hypothetical protein